MGVEWGESHCEEGVFPALRVDFLFFECYCFVEGFWKKTSKIYLSCPVQSEDCCSFLALPCPGGRGGGIRYAWALEDFPVHSSEGGTGNILDLSKPGLETSRVLEPDLELGLSSAQMVQVQN